MSLPREFSVLLRSGKTFRFHALKKSEANEVAERLCGEGDEVIQVCPLNPVVDWEKPVYTVEEAAALFGYDKSKIYGEIEAGRMPFSKPLGGLPRFDKAKLMLLMRATETVPENIKALEESESSAPYFAVKTK